MSVGLRIPSINTFIFLLLSTVALAEPSQSLTGLIPELKDYRPGRYLSWEKYEQLSEEFDEAWRLSNQGVDSETPLERLNRAIEPDAILSMLSLLTDGQARTFYGTYTDPVKLVVEKANDYSPSMDGLIGFRVVRQTTRDRRLISSIQSYLPKGDRFVARGGRDAIRVRFQVAPFGEAGPERDGTGVVGFSWTTVTDSAGKLVRLESQTYTTRDSSKAYGNAHPMMKFNDVNPCGFASHCNLCHHRERLNTFSDAYREKELAKTLGYRAALGAMTQTSCEEQCRPIAEERLKALLSAPDRTFPKEELIRALVARWHQVRPQAASRDGRDFFLEK